MDDASGVPGAASTEGDAGGARQIRALVVEDDPVVAELVRRSLTRAGMTVAVVSDLSSSRAQMAAEPPDVVVLDVGLPDGSGLDLLRDRVALGDVPVVVLSAHQSEVDRVVGLELGAEDYVIKPFFPRELATRVRRAASRRRPAPATRLIVGDLTVDLAAREAAIRGDVVALTDREFDLLAYLAASPRRVIGREELLREVWHSDPQWQSARTVNEHIRRLRRKVEDDPSRPRRLVTIGGAGYRLEP